MFCDQKDLIILNEEINSKPRKYFFPLTTNYDYFNKADTVKLYNLEQAFDVSSRVLCLPLYPDLEIENVDKVVEIVKSVIRNRHTCS